MKALYIDDVRTVPEDFTHYARRFYDALFMLQFEDWDVISFDYDLSSDIEKDDGLTLMNILEELVHNGVRKAPKVIKVHTANPAARPAMLMCAESIMKMGGK